MTSAKRANREHASAGSKQAMRGMDIMEEKLISAKRAAERLGYEWPAEKRAFYAFADRHLKPAKVHVGRTVRFDEQLVAAVIRRPEPGTVVITAEGLERARQEGIALARGQSVDRQRR
jgi:hypothetical protein